MTNGARTYKLFVWDSVFCSYTCGFAFAVAKDVEEARSVLRKHLDKWDWKDLDAKPKVIYLTKPYCNYVRGGG